MEIKTKKVYYCDFCKKKRMRKDIILEHEKHCTLNPNRQCRLCGRKGVDKDGIVFLQKEFQKLMSHKDENERINGEYCAEWRKTIQELADKQGCPICTLATLRQSNTGWNKWILREWDFKEELKKYWEERNRKEVEEDMF